MLKKTGVHLVNVVITVGRPSILNGVNDFTRIGPFLETRKDLFIENLSFICYKDLCPAIYDICLAEYLYQQNNLMQAEVLVSHVLKEFDDDFNRRLYFLRRSFAGAYGSLRLTGGRPEGPDEGKEAVRKEAAGPGLPLT